MKFPPPSPKGEGGFVPEAPTPAENTQMKRFLTQATVAGTALTTATVALASEAPDSGVTEMNAGPGTFFLLLGGVGALGVVLWLMLKVMNRKKS